MAKSTVFIGLSVLLVSGCLSKIEDQTKKSPNSIIGKTTQDIGKHDPEAKQEVSDQKIQASDPITAPLIAYGPITERAAIASITHAVNLYQAEHGRYPKDYDEFMNEIIKKNNIRLPVLPFGAKYQYDEANHQLVVVKAENAAEKKDN